MIRVFKQYYPIRNIFFVIGEGFMIYFSVFFAAYALRNTELFVPDSAMALKMLLTTIVCQICLYYGDLYDMSTSKSAVDLCIRLMQALGVAAILLAIIYFIFPRTMLNVGNYIVSALILLFLLSSWRIGYALVLNRGLFDKKIILIGSDELAQKINNEIVQKKDCGYQVACIVLEKYHQGTIADAKTPVIRKKGYQGLCALARKLYIDTIVVAIKEKRGELPTKELLQCRIDGIEVIDGISFYETLSGKLLVEHISPSWLIFSDGFQKSKIKKNLKRLTDIILSALLLITFAPILCVVMLLIKIDSKGPVFYSQERIGERHRIYMIYKFRSMFTDAEEKTGPVFTTKDDDRITRFGRFLRKWRIDEIPQLWNVLRGEMSFVGPRPEREFFVKQLEQEIPYYRERFSVKPGITGWAQVCYRYGYTLEDAVEKLNYDLFYIKNMSILMDLMIILRTIKIVLFGIGAH
jgi:sugar transferase (PEP-CTERM system associated)